MNIIITFKQDIDCETKIFLKNSVPKSVFRNIEVNFKPLRCCNILQKNQNSSIQWFFKTTKNSTPLLRKCFKTKFFAKKKISANFKLLGYSNFMQKNQKNSMHEVLINLVKSQFGWHFLAQKPQNKAFVKKVISVIFKLL